MLLRKPPNAELRPVFSLVSVVRERFPDAWRMLVEAPDLRGFDLSLASTTLRPEAENVHLWGDKRGDTAPTSEAYVEDSGRGIVGQPLPIRITAMMRKLMHSA